MAHALTKNQAFLWEAVKPDHELDFEFVGWIHFQLFQCVLGLFDDFWPNTTM